MKNIIEVIKENKGIILKRGLIALGAAAGLTLIGGLLTRNVDEEDYVEIGDDTDENDDSDSDE